MTIDNIYRQRFFIFALLGFLLTAPSAAEESSTHWSLKNIPSPSLPSFTSWSRGPIDTFIENRLMQAGLVPSPVADRPTFIRRLSLDLLGLPPTPEETATFLADTSPDAAEKLLDRTLSSPRYGERWATHWLDVVRFAESSGYEMNYWFPNAWPYRDYVIRSLNEDKAYDQFLFEQVAGDQVAVDAATGFLVAGPYDRSLNQDLEFKARQRQDQLDEIVTTTSSAMLGLTIGCARCHDHMFDPILQKDYYALQAIFAGVQYKERRWRGPENDQWQQQLPALQAQIEPLREALELHRQDLGLRPSLIPEGTEEPFPVTLTTSIRLLIQATSDDKPAQLDAIEIWSTEKTPRNIALTDQGATILASGHSVGGGAKLPDGLIDGISEGDIFWRADKTGPAWLQITFPQPVSVNRLVWRGRGLNGTPVDYRVEALHKEIPSDVKSMPSERPPSAWKQIAHSHNRLPYHNDQRPANKVQLTNASEDQTIEIMSLTHQWAELQEEYQRLADGPQVFAGKFTAPPQTHLLHRGDPMQPQGRVSPNIPEVLGELHLENTATEPNRRVAFGHWLGNPANPLVSRVIANRLWQFHFGTGLVDTPSDFGIMGSVPTHPDLLDWLATDLIRHRWSLKHLHRRILASKTYHQSSQASDPSVVIDPETRWLWRFPPRRIAAEVLRDSILHCSDNLSFKMYGEGFAFFDRASHFSEALPRSQTEAVTWRRMIYGTKIRQETVDVFGDFDCPDAGQSTPQRSRSTTPLQALNLFNSDFVNLQAEQFSKTVAALYPTDMKSQIRHAHFVALTRYPTTSELTVLHKLGAAHGLTQVCRVLFNTNDFVFLD